MLIFFKLSDGDIVWKFSNKISLMFENLKIHFMTWCCHIIPVFKGQCLFAGTPLPLSHAIRESYGYLPLPGTQLSEMRELRGLGQEKSDMCGLFVNVHELSVVSLLTDGACTQALLAPEFTLNETNWCLPPPGSPFLAAASLASLASNGIALVSMSTKGSAPNWQFEQIVQLGEVRWWVLPKGSWEWWLWSGKTVWETEDE